jgi:hypothetical protein
MHLRSRLLAFASVALAISLSCCAPALASGSSSVIVRVEGATHTLVGPVAVSTPEQPVSPIGNSEHSCPGDTALGALAAATGGQWSGSWFEGFGYSIESVLGESHAFGSGEFWDVWFRHSESESGLCDISEPAAGSEVLLFPCPESGACPSPLGLSAPETVNVGEAVPVHVVSYSPSGTAAPVSGASVTGAGAPATTGPEGGATVTFSSTGEATLEATAPGSVRDEIQVCVHHGEDGNCGTASPERTSSAGSTAAQGGTQGSITSQAPYTGPYALVPKLSTVRNGITYARSAAPRLLAGTISAHAPVTGVSLELRRDHHGRCSFFDATRARFVAARCGHGQAFAVSTTAAFSYLLPKRLGPGRYVLDVSATDAAGNHTTLARGTSRLVFHVR